MDKKKLLEVLADFGERNSIDFEPTTDLVEQDGWIDVVLLTEEPYPAHCPVILSVCPDNLACVRVRFDSDAEFEDYGTDGYGEPIAAADSGNYTWEEHLEMCESHARAYAEDLRAELDKLGA